MEKVIEYFKENVDKVKSDDEIGMFIFRLMDMVQTEGNGNINMMPIGDFLKEGFLQEVNRLMLHRCGLALQVSTVDDYWFISGVWDYRDDPEGMLFGAGMISSEKVENVRNLMTAKKEERIRTGLCDENGIQKLNKE